VGILELDQVVMRGFIFGLIHVSILVIGYYSGWSINRLLKIASNGYVADPTMRSAALGIVLGGAIPLIAIPILEKYIIKSEKHIMVGDHEDIEKDLKSSHD